MWFVCIEVRIIIGIRGIITLLYETSLGVANEKVREISLKFSSMKYNENPNSNFRVVAFVHVRKDRVISMGILRGYKYPINPTSILNFRFL